VLPDPGYCTLAAVWPASLTVTAPPQVQVHWDESSRALTSATVTWAEPGDHGDSTGWHGCGVRAPPAAFVAEATCGFDRLWHIPNGGTFAAAVSFTTPTAPPANVLVPEAANVAGVVPKEHCSVAPVQTTFGMADLPPDVPSLRLFTLLIRVTVYQTAALPTELHRR
jgi:hypothetical protein